MVRGVVDLEMSVYFSLCHSPNLILYKFMYFLRWTDGVCFFAHFWFSIYGRHKQRKKQTVKKWKA